MTEFSIREFRITAPGPDAGDLESLRTQMAWLDFAYDAEGIKERSGELNDSRGVRDLQMQNIEDQMDIEAGIVRLSEE